MGNGRRGDELCILEFKTLTGKPSRLVFVPALEWDVSFGSNE